MIELRTLGTVDLTDASNGGDPGVVRSRPKALALLVYLALASRRGPVRRDRLLALLWPELPEPRARRALSQTLYAIRQDLGRDVIEGCGKDDLRVVPAALACDARDFQAALAADRMRDALRLYRGELLPGFHVSRCPDFDRWLEERRAELRRTAVRAALALAETEAVEGRHLAATRSVRWALAHAPHDEGVLLEGLSLLDRMGNRAGALDAYEEFVRRLRTELELEPAPETVARVEVMRKRHGEATPSRLTPPPLPERHAARDRTPARPPPAAPASRWPALATVLALGLFLTVWGLATTVRTDRRPAVPNGLSEVTMAVLPFRVSGPGMEIWREGMVDLLSANLDGTAGLRAVDARAVLAGVDRRSEDARAPRDRTALLETARSLGADYALVGTVAAVGPTLRIVVDVHDLETGEPWRTRVEGPADSTLALLDRLSRTLLTEGPATAALLPGTDVRWIRTRSLPALRAFLAGEQAHRRGDNEDAAEHFRTALQLDSTFALAAYRFAFSDLWANAGTSIRANEYLERAARMADRVPERDAMLLRSVSMFPAEQVATLEELTRRHPDFVLGWWTLGETYFHWAPLEPEAAARARTAFREVLWLDPTYLPAAIHLMGDAFARRDSTAARQLLERWAGMDPANPDVIGWRLGYELAWGSRPARERAEEALDTASTEVLTSAAVPYQQTCSHGMFEPWHRLGDALLDERHPETLGEWRHIRAYVCQGRMEHARSALLARIEDAETYPKTWRTLLGWHLAGYPDPDGARRAAEALARDPTPGDRYRIGALAALEGRRADVLAQIDTLEREARGSEARGDPADAAERAAWAEALRGVDAAGRGDLDGAIMPLERAVRALRPPTGTAGLRFRLGELLAEVGRLEEAERFFESFYWASWPYWAPSQLHLGRIDEAQGDLEGARTHYRRVVHAWEACDPQLRASLAEARRALLRLGPAPPA